MHPSKIHPVNLDTTRKEMQHFMRNMTLTPKSHDKEITRNIELVGKRQISQVEQLQKNAEIYRIMGIDM